MSYQISPGIVCENGMVLGRISDIELFDSFYVQTDQTRLNPENDSVESTYLFDKETRKRLASDSNGGRLWETNRKGKKRIQQEENKRIEREKKLRVEVMREAMEYWNDE